MHIISYTCESCGRTHTRQAGMTTDGMCPLCEYPMRIQDLFSDRRKLAVPVMFDRRAQARPEAA